MVRRGRPVLAILCALGLTPLLGCGNGIKCVPVSGTVTLDGQPLQGVVVAFTPDASKGNTARASCTGPVRDGRYELQTIGVTRYESGRGAPPGWYKVTLIADLPGQPKVNLNGAYTNVARTPLSVEVVAEPPPGSYDLKLMR